MTTILSFINKLIDVPTSDPDDRRRKRLLNILLLGTALLPIPLIPISVFFAGQLVDNAHDAAIIVDVAIAVFLVSAALYFINRAVKGTLAAIFFLLFLCIIFLFADDPQELANGRSLILFAVPILFSSVLLNPGSSFLFAAISSVEIVLLALSIGIIPNYPTVVVYFALGLISWLSSRSLEQALRDLRSINTNLDRLVHERTQELSDALAREKIQAGRNRAILDSIADGVIVFDNQLQSIMANPALQGLTGIPFDGVTNLERLLDVGSLSGSDREKLSTLFNKSGVEESSRLDWGNKTLSIKAAPVLDTDANLIGTVAVFRDITKEAEVERMKSKFVGVVSHELRTPLSAILGLVEMLKLGIFGPINEKQAKSTDRIMFNTRRLLDLVNDLLDQAQIEAGKLKIKIEPFKPDDLLENVRSMMTKTAATKGLPLYGELDPDLPETMLGDARRLQQILINLVNNAIKFTKDGQIDIHIFGVDPTHWGMRVRDTGIGIPEDEIERVFESFHQVDNTAARFYGGAGLGLSIVKELVDLMDGTISLTSKVNEGSAFTIVFPILGPQEIKHE